MLDLDFTEKDAETHFYRENIIKSAPQRRWNYICTEKTR